MKTKTQFLEDWNQSLHINGIGSNKGYYNLCVTLRDLKLWQKGIKPNKNFRLKDVKNYFGITGNAEAMLQRLSDFQKAIKDMENLTISQK